MSNSIVTGIVSFVNHEKKYVLIEYEQNGRKKTVNGDIAEKQLKQKHRFQIGDTVSFKIRLSGRGDRMVADEMHFLYNSGLDVLLNRAKTENNFTGYLKIVAGRYFVKETETYLFFPVPFSPWQVKPSEAELNEAVIFSLENMENKEKVAASLFHKKFIPEYYSAVKAYKTKAAVDGEVYKVTPHGIYLFLYGKTIQAKFPNTLNSLINPGDKIKVRITYLGDSRITVDQV